MTTKQKFKSDAFAAIHASATALCRVGAIDPATMHKFDESCLTSESTVQRWESGSKQPSGTALKLLAVVQKHGFGVLA